jgi:hypothetical protein
LVRRRLHFDEYQSWQLPPALITESEDDTRRPMLRENGSRARPPGIHTFFIEGKTRDFPSSYSIAGANSGRKPNVLI